jgi:hypothetical protein
MSFFVLSPPFAEAEKETCLFNSIKKGISRRNAVRNLIKDEWFYDTVFFLVCKELFSLFYGLFLQEFVHFVLRPQWRPSIDLQFISIVPFRNSDKVTVKDRSNPL